MDSKKKRLSLGDINRKLNEGTGPQPDSLRSSPPASESKPEARPRKFVMPPLPEKLESPASKAQSPASPHIPLPPLPPTDPHTHVSHETHSAIPGSPAHVHHAQPSTLTHMAHQAVKMGDREDEDEFDLFRYLAIILRRKTIIAAVTMGFALFSVFSYITAQKYFATSARLLFRPGQNVMLPNQVVYWDDNEKAFNTHLEMIKSVIVLERVAQNLDGMVKPEEIRSGLTLKQGETEGVKTDIIELSFKHPNAETARDVLNELCRTYIEYHREVNAQEQTRLILNIKTQIDKLQIDLEDKENALRKFKESNRLLQLSREANVVVTKLAAIEVELQQTQLALLTNKEQLGALKSQISQQDIDIVQSMTYENPFQSRISELQLELNTLSAEYSDDHFKIRTLRDQIKSLEDGAKSEIARDAVSKTFVKNPIRENLLEQLVSLTVQIVSLEAKRTAQEQIVEKLNVELMALPSLEQQFASLQRETDSRLQTLQILKQKYEETKIERDAKESDIKVLELARLPKRAISSKSVSRVVMGVLVGLILGIALAFLLEYLDQTLKDVTQVEKILEIPLIGTVPHIDFETEKASIESPGKIAKSVLEPFRALRANLKHLASTHNAKVLMVCSAVKGEGKTTLSMNLALTFALDGKKVILIDADLRRSQIHHLLSIRKETGMYDFLNGDKELQDIIKKTKHENLFAITAGERPYNPAELLGTPRFDVLLQQIREVADVIIFDSPALLPVSDSLIMAPKMDACLMVVRTLWTPIRAAKQAISQLNRIGSKMMGCILNGIPHARGYYPYYYGYYGYYSYRYSYEEESQKKFSLRQLGLNVETRIREMLQNAPHAVPRYVAVAGRFCGHIAGKMTFWILLFVLISITGIRFYIQRTGAQHEADGRLISYLGSSQSRETVMHEPIQVRENYVLEQSATDSGPEKGQENEFVMTDTLAGLPPAFSYKEILAAWVSARNMCDSAAFALFYDTAEFQYPKGGASEWVRENVAKWLRKETREDIISMDTIITTRFSDDLFRTVAVMSVCSDDDTVDVEQTMMWRHSGTKWQIIREETQAAP